MIRFYNKDDLCSIMDIWLDSNIKAHNFIDPIYWRNNFSIVKEMMPQARLYVYEQQKELAGFIGIMEEYIAGIFVSSSQQSKGIGQELLNYAKSNHKELYLTVYKKNERAVTFYLREGFIIENKQIDDATGETEFVMAWTELK